MTYLALAICFVGGVLVGSAHSGLAVIGMAMSQFGTVIYCHSVWNKDE